MILSATSRSLLSQDMGGDGFSKGIADGQFLHATHASGTWLAYPGRKAGLRDRISSIACKDARPCDNGHDLNIADAHSQTPLSGLEDVQALGPSDSDPRSPPYGGRREAGHDLKQEEPGSIATRTKRGDAPADLRRDE